MRFAEAMTRTPVDVPDDLFQSLSQQLAPPQIVELAAAIAMENFSARFNHAFGIESPHPAK